MTVVNAVSGSGSEGSARIDDALWAAESTVFVAAAKEVAQCDLVVLDYMPEPGSPYAVTVNCDTTGAVMSWIRTLNSSD